MNFYAALARYYDSEHVDKTDDLALYTEIADEAIGDGDDPVLIIGSGTGRVVFHLAQEGYTVHGIEMEEQMLERSLIKRDALTHLGSRVKFYNGDALTVNVPGQFGLVIIPYNTLMHFHEREKHLGLLKRARQWVKQGGRLLIDLPNAGEAYAAQDTEALTLERTFLDVDTGNLVMQQSVSRLDRAEQLMSVTWIYDEITEDGLVQRTVIPVVIRYFFHSEMELLLQAAGFEVEDVFGDFDRIPFYDGVPRMIVLAK